MDSLSVQPSGRPASSRIELLRDRFESEWRSGQRPRIEDFLSDTAEPESATLLAELIAIELEYRHQRGEKPSYAEYAVRFPGHEDTLGRFDFNFIGRATRDDRARDKTVDSPEENFVLGHFRLTQELGSGAYGIVWKARDTQLDRTVAVKVPRKYQLDADETQKFLREARAAAQLKHPHIVAVHEVGDDSHPYIVSDYIAGITLKERLKGEPLSFRHAAELCRTVAEALQHAHEAGVVHRDMKPGNILLDAKGEPHIADFGLAKRETGELTVTVDGQVMGTPAYMSPEQAAGKSHEADARSDIYSLGVILYETLTGAVPFRGNAHAVSRQIAHSEPKRPRTHNRAIPRDLETICLKAMAKEPHRRYATAADLAADLQRYLEGKPIHARRAGVVERTWRWCRRNTALAVSTLLTVSAGGALMLAFFILPGGQAGNSKLKTVTITTEPPGAKVAFIPLDRVTNEPQPEKIVHALGVSPVEAKLEPGMYLVEAYFNDTTFHEVYRTVPSDRDGIAWGYRYWRRLKNGVIELPRVKIPEPSVVDGMALILGSEGYQMRSADSPVAIGNQRSVPSFYIDPVEFTVGAYLDWRSPNRIPPTNSTWVPLPDDYAVARNCLEAAAIAETLGKRLPSEVEYEFAATARGTQKYPWGNEIPADAEGITDFGPVGTPEFDRLPTNPPVFGLCSNVAEWTSTWVPSNPQARERGLPYDLFPFAERAVRGGTAEILEGSALVSAETRDPRKRLAVQEVAEKRGLGFRCVRSTKPRLRPEDFVRSAEN